MILNPRDDYWYSRRFIEQVEATERKLLRIVDEGPNPGVELYHRLMLNYSTDVLPVAESHKPVEVLLLLRLTQFVDVDEKNQIMMSNVWVRHEWNDSGLVWNPDDYAGITNLNIPASDIWIPDTVLYNKYKFHLLFAFFYFD